MMKHLALLGLVVGTIGCSTSVTSTRSNPLETGRVIDLSHAYDASTVYWPTSPSSFKLEQLSEGINASGFFYASNTFCTPEHGGTHLDAPIHFAEKGWRTDEIPVERLVGRAVVIDVAPAAAQDPDYRLTTADVQNWESRNGRIPAGSFVILRTNWSKRWPNRKAYMGDDTPNDASNLHFPSFGEEAARVLVSERKVAALGVDTASIDHGPSKTFMVHRVAGAANVLGFENLTN